MKFLVGFILGVFLILLWSYSLTRVENFGREFHPIWIVAIAYSIFCLFLLVKEIHCNWEPVKEETKETISKEK